MKERETDRKGGAFREQFVVQELVLERFRSKRIGLGGRKVEAREDLELFADVQKRDQCVRVSDAVIMDGPLRVKKSRNRMLTQVSAV